MEVGFLGWVHENQQFAGSLVLALGGVFGYLINRIYHKKANIDKAKAAALVILSRFETAFLRYSWYASLIKLYEKDYELHEEGEIDDEKLERSKEHSKTLLKRNIKEHRQAFKFDEVLMYDLSFLGAETKPVFDFFYSDKKFLLGLERLALFEVDQIY